MSTVRRLVLGNWPLKLAAIGLATVLYAGVAISEGSRTWTGPVPIEVLGAPAGGALVELPGAVEEITYRAPADVASQLTASSFRASIDLSPIVPRLGADPVEVAVDVFPVDPRVRVLDHSPRGVNVRLDEVVSRPMAVAVETGTVPAGIEIGPVTADPGQVTLRGASSRVANVRSVEGRIVVDGSGIDIDQEVALEAYDEVGALVPGVEIDPASVRVSADVSRQLARATLPVVPELGGEPGDDTVVVRATVVPPVVTVSGDEGAIRELEAIGAGPIDLGGRDASFTMEVPLRLPDDVTALGVSMVRIEIELAPALGSRAFEVATVATDAGGVEGIDTDSVRVVLAGPTRMLDAIDPTALLAELPTAGLGPGSHPVEPLVVPPDGLRVVRIEPATVDVRVGEPA